MTKTALREKTYRKLLENILKGKLKPGSRIIESQFSKDLDISRTPLREALLKLSAEGLVESSLNKGFSVSDLSAREVRELYPILWTLEGLALELGGSLVFEKMQVLNRINLQFKELKAKNRQALKLDSNFHNQLIECCPNRRLLKTISELRAKVERYEQIYMQGACHLRISFKQHKGIIAALEDSDIEKAIQALKSNWRFGMEVILRKLGEVI